MWGLIFVGPLLVPDYPAALQSTGRYLAFGLITLPLAWFDRRRLRKLRRRDWLEALADGHRQSAVLPVPASAIQRTGAPVSTMIIGTLPVVIALCANLLRPARRAAGPGKLAPALLLIVCGLACVNVAELRGNALPIDGWRYLSGLGWPCWR